MSVTEQSQDSIKKYFDEEFEEHIMPIIEGEKDRTGKWGYCDLYNSKTGEVWELKKTV